MADVFQVHCPSFQAIVIATRAEVVRRPAKEPTTLTTDSRGIPADSCFVALQGEQFDGHAFITAAANAGAAMAIVQTIPSDEILAALPAGFGILRVKCTRVALGLIAHAWRCSLRQLRVVAVTGSAGKTTTRRLLEGILAQAGVTHASPKSFNNDVGVPLTLLSTPNDAAYLVAEIGMNHPGEIVPLAQMVEPEVAIITLAGRAHLEGLGSVEAVAAEKASILAGVSPSGVAIINGDNPPLLNAVARRVETGDAPDRVILFGLSASCDYRLMGRTPVVLLSSDQQIDGQEIEVKLPHHAVVNGDDDDVVGGGDRRRRFTLKMSGEHNARNALAAIAAAYEMGISEDAIRTGLAQVVATEMRLERLMIAQRTVYNDAYNANPDAMIASLKAFAEITTHAPRRVVVLGEMRELGPDARALHQEVGTHAARALQPTDALVAVGPHASALVEAAKNAGFTGQTRCSELFTEAFALDTSSLAPIGTAILLKGSRGARMERFLAPLTQAFDVASG